MSPGEVKNLRLARFLIAMSKFLIKGGGKYLPEEKIKERLVICQACDQFTGRSCKDCGCTCNNKKIFLNKLALPTESCPRSKWQNEI